MSAVSSLLRLHAHRTLLRRHVRLLPPHQYALIPLSARAFRLSPASCSKSNAAEPAAASPGAGSSTVSITSTPVEEAEAEPRVMYTLKPKWYLRFIWIVIGMEAVMVYNFSDAVMKHWTIADETGAKDENNQTIHHLRPLWQRSLASGGIIGAGVLVGMLFVNFRFRFVHRILLHPDGKRVCLQSSTAAHRWDQVPHWARRIGIGRRTFVEKKLLKMKPGRDDTELMLMRSGKILGYYVGLEDATINGQSGSVWANRKMMQEAWHGVEIGGRGRWVS